MKFLAACLAGLLTLAPGASAATLFDGSQKMGCQYSASPPTLADGVEGLVQCDATGQLKTTAASVAAITPVVSASAESSHVLKAAPGSLYGAYATNLTATAGFLVVINAASAPADGAITPLACVPLPAGGVASINHKPGPPQAYSTGITVVVTSATNCFTKTTGVITAFLSGDAT